MDGRLSAVRPSASDRSGPPDHSSGSSSGSPGTICPADSGPGAASRTSAAGAQADRGAAPVQP